MDKGIIQQAKREAKKIYDDYMKSINCHNPRYKRPWERRDLDDGRYYYSLKGTPDKMHIIVDEETNEITILDGAFRIIKIMQVN